MHLYVHVPFCRRRCSYCDFSIAVRKQIPADEYVDAVLRELEFVRGSSGWVYPGATNQADQGGLTPGRRPGETPGAGTLYLGGGTPSLLPLPALDRLVTALRARCASDAEVTLEANPEDVTSAAASAWVAMGINRISLGAQSFDDRVLKWMHRPHDAGQTARAVERLREAGIENISLDLIFAVPSDLQRDWDNDLLQACSLLPAHLSLYGLTVEERTPLARWISRGATSVPDDTRYAAEYLRAHQRLGGSGYQFYEVSNAAREGQVSRHNSAYWTGRPYVGLGPAAHSFDGRTRRWNQPAWAEYRRTVERGDSPVASEEVLTDEQRELERLYLGLRTTQGVALTDFPSFRLSDWVAAGWVVAAEGRVKCTPEGWLRLDALVGALTDRRAVS
jgi:putative oxygen-independent coproporphyrinogen III oxidase